MYIQRHRDKDGNYIESYEDYAKRRKQAKIIFKRYLRAEYPFNEVPRKRAPKK